MRSWKKRIRKAFGLLLCLAFLAGTFSVDSYALAGWASDCYVASEGACLMDADSGVVLFGENEHEAYYPASITKVMTALVVLENCPNLNETVTFSYDAVHIEEANSTIIGASEGDRLSVLDCLYCLLFQSANEVANALAEHAGAKHPELKEKGKTDRDVFIRMMNEKAESLGCLGTHFNNPSGLTDEQHYTTPFDMCLIMAAAIRNERFLDIEKHTYWTHAPIRRYPDASDPWNTVYPKHLMLKKNSAQYYPGTIAGKTGYTVTAGNTLVTACRKNGMTLVTTVMNAHANHYNDTRRLMDFGFDNFRSVRIADYEDAGAAVESDLSVKGLPVIDFRGLSLNGDARVSLPLEADFADVTKTVTASEAANGESFVLAEYYYGDRKVGSAELRLKDMGISRLEAFRSDPMLAAMESQTAPEVIGTDEGGEEEATAEGQPGPARRPARRFLDTVPPLLKFAGGVLLLAAAFLGVRFLSEWKQQKAREKRRRKRIQRTLDLSGSQTIKLELMLQEKLKKNKKKRS